MSKENENHSAQVARLELSLAKKEAECEVHVAERYKLQEEVVKWRKEKEALDIALKAVVDNFAATSASMAQGHRQQQNELECRMREAGRAPNDTLCAQNKPQDSALELGRERLARESCEKTCRDLRKEMLSCKEEVDRVWEELNTSRETQRRVIRNLEESLSQAIQERDNTMKIATNCQEERLRHFESLVMEKASQERKQLEDASQKLEQQLARCAAEKSTLERQTSHLMDDLSKARTAKQEQDALVVELRTSLVQAHAEREAMCKSVGDLETSLAALKMERRVLQR